MKKLSAGLVLLIAAFAGFFVTSCDTNSGVSSIEVRFQVAFPEFYAEPFAENAEVSLTSIERNETTVQTTDENGFTVFGNLIPGRYDIRAELSLTADQAFDLTGTAEEITLSVSLNNENLIESNVDPILLQLRGSVLGNFVFKEVYYTGSKTPAGGNYFNDQFHEIFNNSTEVLFADGLYIADVFGPAGQINPTTQPTPFQFDQDHVYLNSVWRVPGSGTDHPIQPGGSFIIAQTAQDHRDNPDLNPNSPVNLGDADFETYNQRDDDRDIDNPNVLNMERIYFTGGFTWLVPVFGPALVIFRVDDFDALELVPVPDASPAFPPRVKLPIELVIDSFEALQNPQSGDFKRLPLQLNPGFVSASGTYTAESARRLTDRIIDGRRILRNTGDTGEDFEIIPTPTPRSFD
ncbi:Protein of unknown function (DUF4876) [Cyclonatronum proteinivorum]|uniref:DUF4876 domain-containing protein n=1 Tax=Cyclonatronum proteinivorum TaxID=1457365 RepID=A0A345UKT0_9BACT|nr:DUF4876 domain-containing protein [Cyclonatronum proteinivorum]AXJ01082.1 Protein of unknown function (DUF4876) [Cyclonatronum proteinivorum]